MMIMKMTQTWKIPLPRIYPSVYPTDQDIPPTPDLDAEPDSDRMFLNYKRTESASHPRPSSPIILFS